ncbi:MAG: hypothetical protein ACYC7E_00295 [Armatimonadota bacterium]
MSSEHSLRQQIWKIVRSSGIAALCLLRIAILWVLVRVGTFIFHPFWDGAYSSHIPELDALLQPSLRLQRECERAALLCRRLLASVHQFLAEIEALSVSGPAPVVFQITREVRHGQVSVREFEEQLARVQAAIEHAKAQPAFDPPPPVPVLGIKDPVWCRKNLPPYLAQRKEQLRQVQKQLLPPVREVVEQAMQAFAGYQEGEMAHATRQELPWARMKRTLRSMRDQLADRKEHLNTLLRQRTSLLQTLEKALQTDKERTPPRQAVRLAQYLGINEVTSGGLPGLTSLYDELIVQQGHESKRRRNRRLPAAYEQLQEMERSLTEADGLLPQAEIALVGKQDLYCTVNPQGCERCPICREYHDRVAIAWKDLKAQVAARERLVRQKLEKAEKFYGRNVPLAQQLRRDAGETKRPAGGRK